MGLKDLIAGALKPAADAFQARVARKQAQETAAAKLAQAKFDGALQLEFNDQELERLSTALTEKTFKDEYITISIVLIVNLFVVGGILTAFGYPELLDGVVMGVERLVAVGVDMGFIIEAVVFAGIGLSVWRKF